MQAEPEFHPPAHWEPASFPRRFGVGRSFVSGDEDGDRLRIHYYADTVRQEFCALAWWGVGAEGPPGHAHGGSMAAVLDEVMGFAAWYEGHPVVAATITVHFRKRLPLGEVLAVRARVCSIEGAKVKTSGRIESLDGTTCYSEAEGIFVERPLDEFGDLMGVVQGE